MHVCCHGTENLQYTTYFFYNKLSGRTLLCIALSEEIAEEIAYDLTKCFRPIFRHFATKKFR